MVDAGNYYMVDAARCWKLRVAGRMCVISCWKVCVISCMSRQTELKRRMTKTDKVNKRQTKSTRGIKTKTDKVSEGTDSCTKTDKDRQS